MARRALSPNTGDYAHSVHTTASKATQQELQRSRKENSLVRVAVESLRRAATSRTVSKGEAENLKTGVESR